MEGENAGEEGEASDDVNMEEADDNEAEAGEEEEQEPDAEEMWNKCLTFLTNKYCKRDLFEIYFQFKAFSPLQDFCSLLQFCKFQEIHKNSQYFQ